MFIQGLLNPVSKKLILNVYWEVVLCQHVKERREKKEAPAIDFVSRLREQRYGDILASTWYVPSTRTWYALC